MHRPTCYTMAARNWENPNFSLLRLFLSPCMDLWGRWYSFEICTIGKTSSNIIDCNKICSGDSSIVLTVSSWCQPAFTYTCTLLWCK